MHIASNLELYWTLFLSEKTWARQSHRRQPTDSKQNGTRLQKEKKKNDNISTGVRSFVEWITVVEGHFYNLHIDIKQG